MRRHAFIASILIATAAFLAAPAASAAEASAKTKGSMTIGVDGMFVIPVGDWADIASVGVGALGRFEYHLATPFALTGRLGFVYNFAKDRGGIDVNTWELPILVGARYYSDIGIFGGAEIGIVFVNVDIGAFGTSASDTSAELGLNLTGGYRMGNLDFGVDLFLPSIGDLFGIGFHVGFNFANLGGK